jgi:hypothetical protein
MKLADELEALAAKASGVLNIQQDRRRIVSNGNVVVDTTQDTTIELAIKLLGNVPTIIAALRASEPREQGEVKCLECRGRGWVERIDMYERPCDVCHGDGFIAAIVKAGEP